MGTPLQHQAVLLRTSLWSESPLCNRRLVMLREIPLLLTRSMGSASGVSTVAAATAAAAVSTPPSISRLLPQMSKRCTSSLRPDVVRLRLPVPRKLIDSNNNNASLFLPRRTFLSACPSRSSVAVCGSTITNSNSNDRHVLRHYHSGTNSNDPTVQNKLDPHIVLHQHQHQYQHQRQCQCQRQTQTIRRPASHEQELEEQGEFARATTAPQPPLILSYSRHTTARNLLHSTTLSSSASSSSLPSSPSPSFHPSLLRSTNLIATPNLSLSLSQTSKLHFLPHDILLSSSRRSHANQIRHISTANLPARALKALRSLYTLDGGEVKVYNGWGRFKWHLRLTIRMLIIVGTVFACLLAFVWASTQMYVEYHHPTPSAFSEGTRISIRYVYLNMEIMDDKILAHENSEGLPERLEEELQKKGGWENAPREVRKAVVDVLLKIAELRTSLGRDAQALELLVKVCEKGMADKELLGGPKLAETLVKLGSAYSRLDRPDDAFGCYQWATQTAWEAMYASTSATMPKVDYEKPVLPIPSANSPPLSPQLIDAVTATATWYCSKSSPPQPGVAFPIFLALIRACEAQPAKERDICREAAVQTYLGEIMFTMGKKQDGYGWTLKALEGAESGLVKGRGRRCAECAGYAVANAILMRKSLGGAEDALEKDVADFRRRERILSRFM